MKLDYKAKLKDTLKHFQTGIAYMLPFIMIGAMGRVIPVLFGQGQSPTNPFFAAIRQVGDTGMSMFIPFMAGYIAYAIADKPAIAPGVVAGIIAKAGGSGYLGGLLGGFLAGYVTYTLGGLRWKISDKWKATWDSFIPALGGLAVSVSIILLLNPPIKELVEAITTFLTNMGKGSSTLLGIVMGMIPGIDFGGPFSQAKFAFAMAALEQDIIVPAGLCYTATVAPIGMCLATYLAPHLFKEEIRNYGRSSLIYAIFGGWTEIAIPFAVDDWWRVSLASVIGGIVGGAIGGYFELGMYAPVPGVFAITVTDKPWVFLIGTFVGAVVTALAVILLKKITKKDTVIEKPGS